jgi:hypothetical protein
VSGRRTHVRYAFVSGLSGSVRVTRGVIITRQSDGEITAVSTVPGVINDELSLDLSTGDDTATATVRVVGSRPIVVDGALRHEIRLREVESSNGQRVT